MLVNVVQRVQYGCVMNVLYPRDGDCVPVRSGHGAHTTTNTSFSTSKCLMEVGLTNNYLMEVEKTLLAGAS